MKAILALVLLFTMNAIAQVPDSKENPQVDPQVAEAKALAQKFIDKVYAGDFTGAGKMMNPNPPQKETSKADVRKYWISQMKEVSSFQGHDKNFQSWGDIVGNRFDKNSSRPQDEEFITLTFWGNLKDGTKFTNKVIVMRKGETMTVNRFSF